MYWQIETTDNCRPGHPEDNIVVIKANSMEEAIKKFTNNRARTTLKGQPINCRQVFYVKDNWE